MESLAIAENSMMRKLQPMFYDWEWEVLLGHREFRERLAETDTADQAAELIELGHHILARMGA